MFLALALCSNLMLVVLIAETRKLIMFCVAYFAFWCLGILDNLWSVLPKRELWIVNLIYLEAPSETSLLFKSRSARAG